MKKLTRLCLIILLGVATAGPLLAQDMQTLFEKNIQFSHNEENWYPPISVAVAGLTDEQTNWSDGSGNHSIRQLVTHLVFWNGRILDAMSGKQVPAFDGNNDKTFDAFSDQDFESLVTELDRILTEIESIAKTLDDEQLKGWGPSLANISSHNAYHTGQIVFIRKQKNWWR